jgi:hypothetical protein
MNSVLKQPWRGCLVATAISVLSVQVAHSAPGEDTIQLKGPVKYVVAPGAQQQASGGMDGPTDIPAWMRARITRYTAKAFSTTADDGSIYTDSDVVTTMQTEGLRKTCVQEVGSNTLPADGAIGNRYGPSAREQVVVLRGDLVNVCR